MQLKEYLKQNKIKIVTFARQIKLSRNTVSRYINNSINPPASIKLLIESIETGNSYPTSLRDNFWTIAIPLCARESHRRGSIPIDVKEYMQFD